MENNHETKKKPLYKKRWPWVVLLLIILVALLINSGSSPTEPSPVQNNTGATKPIASELQTYIQGVQNDVMPLLQLANKRIIDAGNLGSQLQIESAQIQITSAKRFADEAQDALYQLTPPQEAEVVHDLLSQAFAKYVEAIGIYETGIAVLDADTISRGSEVYQEATDLISQATLELNKLQ